MTAPPPDPGTIERRLDVGALGRLGPALASGLNVLDLGGDSAGRRIEESVRAQCIGCGIEVSGADLVAAGIVTNRPTELTAKQQRLQLGYCARRTCNARFYAITFLPVPGVDWAQVWDTAESALVCPAHSPPGRAPMPVLVFRLLGPTIRRLWHPLPLGIIGVLIIFLAARSGCRVPGLSPAPRVFIVPAAALSQPTAPPVHASEP